MSFIDLIFFLTIPNNYKSDYINERFSLSISMCLILKMFPLIIVQVTVTFFLLGFFQFLYM